MVGIVKKSADNLIVKFEGENDVDLKEFTNFLTAMNKQINFIVNKIDENSYVNLKITSIEKGSFLFNLKTLIEPIGAILPLFSTPEARQIIENVIGFLKLRKDIGPSNKVQNIKDGTIIIGNNNTINVSNYNINANIISNDDAILKGINIATEVIKSMPKNRDISFSNNNHNYRFSMQDKENSSNVVELETEIEPKTHKIISTTEIVIKKPDLDMKSKWQVFILDTLKEVKITDEEFKNYVLSGKFKVSHKTKLKVDIEATYKYNENGEDELLELEIVKVYQDENEYKLF